MRTIQGEIETLLASESYNKESAKFVECMTGVIHETVERAKHNDGSMAASYDTLQTSTSELVENMLDNQQFSQCISESEEILRAIEEVMLAPQFSMPLVRELFQSMNQKWRTASTMVAARNQPRLMEWSV